MPPGQRAGVGEGDAPRSMRLSRGERREMVAMLSSTGMSTRAIAPVVGVSHMTASNDLNAGVKTFTPAPSSTAGDANASPGPSAARGLTNSTVSNETVELSTNTSGPTSEESVTGLNGKTYARSARTVANDASASTEHFCSVEQGPTAPEAASQDIKAGVRNLTPEPSATTPVTDEAPAGSVHSG